MTQTTTTTTTTTATLPTMTAPAIIRANYGDTTAYKNAGYTVYPVCRCHGTGLGNPYKSGSLQQKIESFRRYLFGVITDPKNDIRMYDDFVILCRLHLSNHQIALTCHCTPRSQCHADVIRAAVLWYTGQPNFSLALTPRPTRRLILSEGMGSYAAITSMKNPNGNGRKTALYFGGQTGREHNPEGLTQYQYSNELADMGLQPRPPKLWDGEGKLFDRTIGPIHMDNTHQIIETGFFNGHSWFVPFLNGPEQAKGPAQYRPESYLARTKGDYHAATRYAGLAERISLPLSFMNEFKKHRIDGLEWHINEATTIGDPEDAMNYISEGSPYVDPADNDETATDPQASARPAGDAVWGYRPMVDWQDESDEITPDQIRYIEETDDLNAAFKAALNVQSPKLRNQLITTIKHMHALNVKRACKSAPHIKPVLARLLEIKDLSNEKKIKAYLYTMCQGGTWNEKGKKTHFPRPLTKLEENAVWYFWNKRQKQLKKRAAAAPAATAAPVDTGAFQDYQKWIDYYPSLIND